MGEKATLPSTELGLEHCRYFTRRVNFTIQTRPENLTSAHGSTEAGDSRQAAHVAPALMDNGD